MRLHLKATRIAGSFRPQVKVKVKLEMFASFSLRSRWAFSIGLGATAIAFAAAILAPTPARAVDVSCLVPGADSTGWAVATGGDFDGDGTPDIVLGAPCAFARGERRAGRAYVYSGVDGSRLFRVKGEQRLQRLGAGVGFVPDLNGDGHDEVVIGSFGWDGQNDSGGSLPQSGKIDVYSDDAGLLLSVDGKGNSANFGESVDGLPDVTGDGIPDILVGAGDDREGLDKKGRAYLISGSDGSTVDSNVGEFRFDSWGSVVAATEDVNNDGVADVIVASSLADVAQGRTAGTTTSTSTTTTSTTLASSVENVGLVRVLSGADFSVVIGEAFGGREDKLGRAVAAAGQMGFFAGATGADPNGLSKAGTVNLYDWDGTLVDTFAEPQPELNAAFGTSVAAIGDVDDDGFVDFAAGAPTGEGVGRVQALSAADGSLLWTVLGDRDGERVGQTMAGGADFNDDGIDDVVIGAPGDDPNGRRGAGGARVVSGSDGTELFRLKGRRGLETRSYIAGWRVDGRVGIRSFNRRGRRRELRARTFRGLGRGWLSMSMLDRVEDPEPSDLKVIVGTGHAADADTVTVYRADRRGTKLSDFRGIGGAYEGGVNVGGGDVVGDDEEEIIVAQADSGNGFVFARIYQRFDTDPLGRINWFTNNTVTLFQGEDTIIVQSVEQLIDADGANIAVGNVIETLQDDKDEIVAGPAEGTPVVRILDPSGNVITQWLAYVSGQNSGTQVAIGDLNGDGTNEIVTAPSLGLPWVKAFNADGTPFELPGVGEVSFFAFFVATAEGGIRLAVADVDLDGSGEILVASGLDINGTVKVFEADSSEVTGLGDYLPFGPGSTRGLAIAATDRFLRH